MKLKVQFVRCQGWSPKVRVASTVGPRVTGMLSAIRPARVPSAALRRLQILDSQETFPAVPGRPDSSTKNNYLI